MKMSRLLKKTLLFMLVTFGVIAAVSSSYSAWTLNKRLTREYESKALAIGRSLANSSVELLLSGDAARIQSKIDQFLEIEGVSYVLVLARSGDVVAHTFVPEVPQAVIDALWDLRARERGRIRSLSIRTVSAYGEQYIHVSQPVLAGEAGSVHIGMSKTLINQAIRTSVVDNQILTLGLFALCAVAAYFFTDRISKPLMRLTEYARRIRNREFDATIDIEASDEVGELATTLRSTSEELSGLIAGLENAVENATDELQDALATVSAIVNNLADGLLVTDGQGRVLRHNPALRRMLCAGPDALDGADCARFLGSGMADIIARAAPAPDHSCPLPGTGRAGSTLELTATRLDGDVFPAEMSLAVLRLQDDTNVVCILRDITERKHAEDELRHARDEMEDRVRRRTSELSETNQRLVAEAAERSAAEQALRHAEAMYRSIFEHAMEGIFQISPDGSYTAANPAMARIYGYSSSHELLAAANSGMESFHVDQSRGREFWDMLTTDGEVRGFESQARRRDGRVIWITQNARAVADEDGGTRFYEGSVADITDRKEAETALRHQAFHDPLTGLPNRILFMDHMRMAMQRARRRKGSVYAVLYMDLNRFKIINDSLGHNIGDELLVHVARQLEQAVRGMDTVARFGGDEFAVLLEEMRKPREAITIARRIADAVKEPARLSGYDVHTSASIGIVLLTEHYNRPEDLLRDADTAMYRAKEAGGSRLKVFSQRMHEQNVRQLELEVELRRSIDSGEFVTLLQPIVDLEHKRLAGFEALVRWMHPKLGMVSPAEFIPLAEDTGLIHPLGEWVLRDVCSILRDWENTFPKDAAVSISINLSAKQFIQPSLVPQLKELLDLTGITPANLCLEIGENVLMSHSALAADMLAQLHQLGVSLSMDDFGTGYSSLSYLRQFPIDALKIDRSFISRFGEDKETQVLVRSIISLAKNLGVAVVAEGVDTPVQNDMLQQLGCEFAQGYLFSHPVARPEAEALLRGDTTLDI